MKSWGGFYIQDYKYWSKGCSSTAFFDLFIFDLVSPMWSSFTSLIFFIFLNDQFCCWELFVCHWKKSQICYALLDISSLLLVIINHSCTYSNSSFKKYWHSCHFSFTWCRYFKSSPLNRSDALKNHLFFIWANSKISLEIELVFCIRKYLFENLFIPMTWYY